MPGTAILAPGRWETRVPPTASPITLVAIDGLRVRVTRRAVTAPWNSDSDAMVASAPAGPLAVQPPSRSDTAEPVTIPPPDR
jgi:hypothetical protein